MKSSSAEIHIKNKCHYKEAYFSIQQMHLIQICVENPLQFKPKQQAIYYKFDTTIYQSLTK